MLHYATVLVPMGLYAGFLASSQMVVTSAFNPLSWVFIGSVISIAVRSIAAARRTFLDVRPRFGVVALRPVGLVLLYVAFVFPSALATRSFIEERARLLQEACERQGHCPDTMELHSRYGLAWGAKFPIHVMVSAGRFEALAMLDTDWPLIVRAGGLSPR